MNYEKPKIEKDSEYTKKAKKMRERVDALRETDSEYEDSIRELAEEEDEIRKDLTMGGVFNDGKKEKLADKFATKSLEAAENKKKSFRDGLTGLRNKTAFIEEVPGFLKGSLREKEPCSIIMLDFDYFKKVNDEYGHEAGDQVLKKLAEILKEKVREPSFIYRYGGEEFTIFLPGTDRAEAMIVAERVREAVEKEEIEIKFNGKIKKLKKTVSLGVSGTEDLNNPEELLAKKELEISEIKSVMKEMVEKADRALYVSKESGRNQVTKYDVSAERILDKEKKF